MARKSKIISPYMRDTLEYAEAMKLFIDRRIVEQHLEQIDEEIRLVRRVSPPAVEQARRDVFDYGDANVLELAPRVRLQS